MNLRSPGYELLSSRQTLAVQCFRVIWKRYCFCGRNGDRAYGRLITSSLEDIAKEIERDLEQGTRDNDYMQDENADRLKEALKDLERCGVRCHSLERVNEAVAAR